MGALLLTGDPAGVLAPDWRSRIGAEDADRPVGDVARLVAAVPPAATSLPLDPPPLRANAETIAAAAAIVPTPARIARFRRTCLRRPPAAEAGAYRAGAERAGAERAGADTSATGRPDAGLGAAGLAAAGLGAAGLAAAGLGAAGLGAAELEGAGHRAAGFPGDACAVADSGLAA